MIQNSKNEKNPFGLPSGCKNNAGLLRKVQKISTKLTSSTSFWGDNCEQLSEYLNRPAGHPWFTHPLPQPVLAECRPCLGAGAAVPALSQLTSQWVTGTDMSRGWASGGCQVCACARTWRARRMTASVFPVSRQTRKTLTHHLVGGLSSFSGSRCVTSCESSFFSREKSHSEVLANVNKFFWGGCK